VRRAERDDLGSCGFCFTGLERPPASRRAARWPRRSPVIRWMVSSDSNHHLLVVGDVILRQARGPFAVFEPFLAQPEYPPMWKFPHISGHFRESRWSSALSTQTVFFGPGDPFRPLDSGQSRNSVTGLGEPWAIPADVGGGELPPPSRASARNSFQVPSQPADGGKVDLQELHVAASVVRTCYKHGR